MFTSCSFWKEKLQLPGWCRQEEKEQQVLWGHREPGVRGAAALSTCLSALRPALKR